MPDYSELSKPELLDSVKLRRDAGREITGINTASSKPDIIAALQLDDENNGVFVGSDTSAEEIKQHAEANADGALTRAVPEDLQEFKGQYKYLKTSETFGLKIMPADQVRSGKTHHAKSPLKFWDGTEEEFRANFDKL